MKARGRTKPSALRAPRKSPTKLDREIAQSLAAGGQPQLAAIFADPEATKVFAREMRHEIQKKQAAQQTAAGLSTRPYTVKHAEQFEDRVARMLYGRYPTASDARAQADKIGGWVEYEGRVIYGRAPSDHSIRSTRSKRRSAHATSSKAPPSWEAIAVDYKRRAKAAREAGGKVKHYPDGSILVVPTAGSDEYFYQDWQADEFREGIEYKNPELLQYLSFEDLVLAQSQDW